MTQKELVKIRENLTKLVNLTDPELMNFLLTFEIKTEGQMIGEFLSEEFKISPSYRGYTYLVEAILLILKNPAIQRNLVDMVYKPIAEKHNVSYSRIVYHIRKVMEKAWIQVPSETLQKVFGYSNDEKHRRAPKSKEAILALSAYLYETKLGGM